MGHFSNGSQGEHYQNHFCSRCVNMKDDGAGVGCPVWDLHLWNCDKQLSKDPATADAWREALGSLIPRGPDGMNLACKMFVPNHDDYRHVPYRWNEMVLKPRVPGGAGKSPEVRT